MYTHHIPNHLETEDTFILNLSMRQCVMLFVSFCLAYMLFRDLFNIIADPALGLGLGLVGACLVFLAGMALALIRVHRRGLDEWTMVLFLYAIAPKRYIWQWNVQDTFERADVSDTVKQDEKSEAKAEENEW